MYLKVVELAQETAGWTSRFHPIAHPITPLLEDTSGLGLPPGKSKRGAANPPPPHASQQDHTDPACCSPQCCAHCTMETFKHQGKVTFGKGEILITHLSLIIPPCQKCTVIYHQKQV